MTSQELQSLNLPDTPGVYFFLNAKREVLYVGKATSLKDRVRSYFSKDLVLTRGERLVQMVTEAVTVEHITTDSVLEALVVEADRIRKLRPHYNTIGKDDKSFNMLVITDEDFPRILVVRASNLGEFDKIKNTFGPFPYGSELRAALKILRKIFPYRDTCTPAPEQRDPLHPKACFNAQIGMCPGVCAGWMDKTEYRKQVRRIRTFFEGKKDELVRSIERDMHECAREQKFEEAEKYKRMLYSLEHIQDVALIKRDIERAKGIATFRIEAYDIAHMSGKETVGVMTVVEDGELEKSQYRKFRIRGKAGKVSVDDTGNLKEVLTRRFTHPEWPTPNLIVIDGGVAQFNAAKEVLAMHNQKIQREIQLVSVVKDNRHKAKDILGSEEVKAEWSRSILLANVEAHRFAITYHRKLRSKGFRI